MSDDLLLELEITSPVGVSLENIEDLVRVVAREVSLAVEGMKGSVVTFENGWRRIIMDVAKGQRTEIQAARPRLLSAIETRLSLLKQTHILAKWLCKLGRADLPDPDVLLPEIIGMEGLKTRVFDRWQTADDLEDLAARDYPLTTADLDQIGPQRRPPTSYYAEESKSKPARRQCRYSA
jgi:hypothetical protein